MASALRTICCAVHVVRTLGTTLPVNLATRVELDRDGDVKQPGRLPERRDAVLMRSEAVRHADRQTLLQNEEGLNLDSQKNAQDEEICMELSRLEDGVDQLHDLSDKKVDEYIQALMHWRRIFLQRGLAQPSCRQKHVGESFCRVGANFLAGQTNQSQKLNLSAWERHSQELLLFEQQQLGDCSQLLYRFGFDKWQQWAPEAFGNVDFRDFDASAVVGDGDYSRMYAASGQQIPSYGPSGTPLVSFNGGQQMSTERAEHLVLLHTLRKAAPGTELGVNITQVLQFGGGTGDLAALLYDMGFNGTHLIYDTEPMLLMQHYWLRMGGIPSFLGENILPSPASVRKRIVLESMENDRQTLKSHLDLDSMHAAGESLFWGVGTFMEAPEAVRDELRPSLRKFGLIYVVYCHGGPTCQNNTDYIRRIANEDLKYTHDVLAWSPDMKTAHFVAIRKDRGNVTCLEELKCTNETTLAVNSSPAINVTTSFEASVEEAFDWLWIKVHSLRTPQRDAGSVCSIALAAVACITICMLASTPRKDKEFVSGQAHLLERLPFLRRFVSARGAAGAHRPVQAMRHASGPGGIA